MLAAVLWNGAWSVQTLAKMGGASVGGTGGVAMCDVVCMEANTLGSDV